LPCGIFIYYIVGGHLGASSIEVVMVLIVSLPVRYVRGTYVKRPYLKIVFPDVVKIRLKVWVFN
jgi:hypothetical protein